MPRHPRSSAGGVVYHVLNRGNCRMDIFQKTGDFHSFLKLLEQGRQRSNMRILGYCLMSNHWHLILWPRRDGDLSEFMQWITTTHVRRWREHRGNVGEGHLYQGRFKSFPVQDDAHLLTVLRYVEANPLRAKLVKRAEAWRYSSLARIAGGEKTPVGMTPWPVERPADWITRVNAGVPEAEVDRLRQSIKRGRPFGQASWVNRIAKRLGLESTLRNPWRPRKKA